MCHILSGSTISDWLRKHFLICRIKISLWYLAFKKTLSVGQVLDCARIFIASAETYEMTMCRPDDV